MVQVASADDDLVAGAFGIREPRGDLPAVGQEERCSEGVLWLVPGVAFDAAGHRLGRGRGYYDRLLAGVRGPCVGVAWEWQVIGHVPASAHDVPMGWIVTDTRTIACGSGAASQAG
jgi:5-formyltetrahydrofolate cyclo-ligase